METQLLRPPTERCAPAAAIWATLTEAQKASVRQTLIQLCQQLIRHWQAEVPHEPPPATP